MRLFILIALLFSLSITVLLQLYAKSSGKACFISHLIAGNENWSCYGSLTVLELEVNDGGNSSRSSSSGSSHLDVLHIPYFVYADTFLGETKLHCSSIYRAERKICICKMLKLLHPYCFVHCTITNEQMKCCRSYKNFNIHRLADHVTSISGVAFSQLCIHSYIYSVCVLRLWLTVIVISF